MWWDKPSKLNDVALAWEAIRARYVEAIQASTVVSVVSKKAAAGNAHQGIFPLFVRICFVKGRITSEEMKVLNTVFDLRHSRSAYEHINATMIEPFGMLNQYFGSFLLNVSSGEWQSAPIGPTATPA